MVIDEESSASRSVRCACLMRSHIAIAFILCLSTLALSSLANKYTNRKSVKLLRCVRTSSPESMSRKASGDRGSSTNMLKTIILDRYLLGQDQETLDSGKDEEEFSDQDLEPERRSTRLKRFATAETRQAANLNSSLARLVTNLAQAARQQQQRQPNGPAILEQLLSSFGSLARQLMRQREADLQVTLENGTKLLLNLLASLTVNNPLINNSPTLNRLRGSSADVNATQLESWLQVLRAVANRPRPVDSSPSAEPTLPELETEADEAKFIERLNALTLKDLPTRRRSTRPKRSVGSMLLLGGPVGKLYAAMWLHRLMRQQSSVLSQVLMGELVRRFVLPAVLPAATAASLPTRASSPSERDQGGQLANQTAKLDADLTECELEESDQPERMLRVERPGSLVSSALESPLVSVDQTGVSVRLPAGQLSVPHLVPDVYNAVYASLQGAPVVAKAAHLDYMAKMARQVDSDHLLRLLSVASKPAGRARAAQMTPSANNVSLLDTIEQLAGNSSRQQTELRKTIERPVGRQMEEVGPAGRSADLAELVRTLSQARGNSSVLARPAGSRTTNVVNLRVQQVAGDQVLAQASKRKLAAQRVSSTTPLPASNHRNGQVASKASVHVGSARPANYLFQPLVDSKPDEDWERGEHAARWNDVLAHLGDNLGSNRSSVGRR